MTSPRMQRWANFLSAFDYKIEHIEGTKNCFADFVSRHPNKADESDETIDEDNDTSPTINMLSSESFIDRVKIIDETAKEDVLQEVFRHISEKWKNPVNDICIKFFNIRSALTASDNVLRTRGDS